MHPFPFFSLVAATLEVFYALQLEHDERMIILILASCTASVGAIFAINDALKSKP